MATATFSKNAEHPPPLVVFFFFVFSYFYVSVCSSGVKLVPDISTNHLRDVMLQQCGFGIEFLACADFPQTPPLEILLCKHVLPNSSRRALISLTGNETRKGGGEEEEKKKKKKKGRC